MKFPTWVHPGQIRYAAYEWFCMRLLFAYLMFASFRQSGYHPFHWWDAPGRGADFLTQPRPNGIAQFLDVTRVAQPANVPIIAGMLGIFLIIFMLGVAPVISIFSLAIFQIAVGALENSQGNNIYHTSQILALGMVGMGGAALVENIRALRTGGWSGLRAHCAARYTWLAYALRTPATWFRTASAGENLSPEIEARQEQSRSFLIYITQQMIAVAYVVAGLSKLWISKGTWFTDVQHIALQFEKNTLTKFYQELNPRPGIPSVTVFVDAHPTFTSVFFAPGLLLEIFCFLALFNRSLMAVFGVSLMVMHFLIALIMALDFYYNEWLVAIFFVNVPFWWRWLWLRIQQQKTIITPVS
jgi:hypothetical protein